MLTWALLCGVVACSGGPDASLVLRRVDELRGPGRTPVAWNLSFSSTGDAVTVVAVAEGERFERRLPADSECDALVEASAVVVLMLEGDLAEAVEARARVVRTARVSPPAPTAPPAPPASSFDLGLGQGVTLSWPLAWKYVARASWRPAASSFGIGGHLRFQAPRSLRVAPLEIGWTRLEGRLGPEATGRFGPLELSIGIEAVAGVLWLRGTSSTGSADFVSWDLGSSGTLRVSPAQWLGFKPWLELAVVGWFRQHRVVVERTSSTAALPVVEADLLFGVSWGR